MSRMPWGCSACSAGCTAPFVICEAATPSGAPGKSLHPDRRGEEKRKKERHQSTLSDLALLHRHILGWPGVEAVENKSSLHRLVRASPCLSLAADLAFKYSSDWFHVRMCGLLDWENFSLWVSSVFRNYIYICIRCSITDLNSWAYLKKLQILQGSTE